MKICVLLNQTEEPTGDFKSWLPEHEYDYVLIKKATAVKQVTLKFRSL